MAVPSLSDRPLPPSVAAAVWQGDQLGRADEEGVGTGFAALDVELPGRGWPVSTVIELLQPQFSIAEWRLLLPALAPRTGKAAPLLVVGPPHRPYFGGLRRHGLDERHVVLVHAQSPAERLWVTEQAVKADGLAGVIAWLSHARSDQIRRLQSCCSQSAFPTFLIRPEAAQHESSPAPLRLLVRSGPLDDLEVHVLKRRGRAHEGWLRLPATPPGFERLRVDQRSPVAGASEAVPTRPRRVPRHAVAALDGAAAGIGR